MPHYKVLDYKSLDYAHFHNGQVLQPGDMVELTEEVAQQHQEVLQLVDSPANPIINLNTATDSELQNLPYIGKVKAGEIIELRPWETVSDFPEMVGLSDEQWNDVEPLIEV